MSLVSNLFDEVDQLRADYDAQIKRVAELEELLWEVFNESGVEVLGSALVERIDAALTGQPKHGERCQGENCGTTTGQHSRECIEEAARDQGWIPTEEDFKGDAKAEQPAAADEREVVGDMNWLIGLIDEECRYWHERGDEVRRSVCANLLAAVKASPNSVGIALAPAAVVMPERMTTIPEGKTISYAAGYEAALDAVASLNRNTVPLELLGRALSETDSICRTLALRELRAILGAKP